MSAPMPRAQSSGLPEPAPVHEKVSRWAWVILIGVLAGAVAATVLLLLVEWTAPGSGTVAR